MSAFQLKKVEAIQRALAYAGDPSAEVVSVEQDGNSWAVTLSGDFSLPKKGPVGVSLAGHSGCRGTCIAFDATDPDPVGPVSVVAWDWHSNR